MLEPDSRHLLLDALRPPEGSTLDLAVGTTYSLDLGALLTAPLAFAMFDTVGADDSHHALPLAAKVYTDALKRTATLRRT